MSIQSKEKLEILKRKRLIEENVN